jgi:hypothetical protein
MRMGAYLGFLTESSKLGIKPCFRVDAKAKICFFAASKFPAVKKRPLADMNTSRPQHLCQPVAKCGKPAAIDAVTLSGASDEDKTEPCSCTAHMARFCVKS